jgi:hypothetical protein
MTANTRIDYNLFTPFNLFKWSIYALLMVNVWVFLVEDLASSSIEFPDGMGFADIIVGFASSIDTASWVLLILLFELETYVLPDEMIVGRVKLMLHGLRVMLYGIIVYSFYGYLSAYAGYVEYGAAEALMLCSQVDGLSVFMTTHDEYTLLTQENCASIASSSSLFAHSTQAIYADANTLAEAKGLGLIDVINSATWLLICFVLEIDVRLELKGLLEGKKALYSKISKFVLYAILLACAIYWGFNGEFIDFWDAFLWILAFAAIELNMFKWHTEESESQDK